MNTVDQSTKYLDNFWKLIKISPKDIARPVVNHDSHKDILFKKYEPKNQTKYGPHYSVETKYFEVLNNEKIHELPLDAEKVVIDLINEEAATRVIELVTEFIRNDTRRYFVSTYPVS